MVQEIQRSNSASSIARGINELESRLLDLPQIEIPVTHRFAPGIYWREIAVEAGAFIIGHKHKEKHFNILLKGCLRTIVNGKVVELRAPYVFISDAGVRKVARIIEDVVFVNLHATQETDPAKIEEAVIEKSDAFRDHELRKEIETLRSSTDLIELEVSS